MIKCRRHWITFVPACVLAVFFLLVGNSSRHMETQTNVFATCAILAAIIAIPPIIRFFTDYIMLDGDLVVGHLGFIRSKTLSTHISKVQGISLSNGLFGKIFGYHTIRLANAGTAGVEYSFPNMTNAKAFESAVNSRISATIH